MRIAKHSNSTFMTLTIPIEGTEFLFLTWGDYNDDAINIY